MDTLDVKLTRVSSFYKSTSCRDYAMAYKIVIWAPMRIEKSWNVQVSFQRFLSRNCISSSCINIYQLLQFSLYLLFPFHQTTVLVKMVRVVQTVLASTINVIVMMASEDVTASFPTKMNVNTDHAISLRIAPTR